VKIYCNAFAAMSRRKCAPSVPKAPEVWRTPRRSALFVSHRHSRQRPGLRRPSAAFSSATPAIETRERQSPERLHRIVPADMRAGDNKFPEKLCRISGGPVI